MKVLNVYRTYFPVPLDKARLLVEVQNIYSIEKGLIQIVLDGELCGKLAIKLKKTNFTLVGAARFGSQFQLSNGCFQIEL